MERVFSVDHVPWKEHSALAAARGYQFKALTEPSYTRVYSCELIRLRPGDHSVAHLESWNHLFYILSGTGDITIEGSVSVLRHGTVCQVRAGERHSMRNLGCDEMMLLAIYDPPRKRRDD